MKNGKRVVIKKTVYKWLKENTTDEKDDGGPTFRTTKAISSWCNMTPDRVRYICSIHDDIFLSTGKNDDTWSLYERKARSVYDDRGVIDASS